MKRIHRPASRTKRNDQEGTWAVSYGDMITLLLGFYIMYFSIEPPKKGETVLSDSLMTALTKLDAQDIAIQKASTMGVAEAGDPAAGSSKGQIDRVTTSAAQAGSQSQTPLAAQGPETGASIEQKSQLAQSGGAPAKAGQNKDGSTAPNPLAQAGSQEGAAQDGTPGQLLTGGAPRTSGTDSAGTNLLFNQLTRSDRTGAEPDGEEGLLREGGIPGQAGSTPQGATALREKQEGVGSQPTGQEAAIMPGSNPKASGSASEGNTGVSVAGADSAVLSSGSQVEIKDGGVGSAVDPSKSAATPSTKASEGKESSMQMAAKTLTGSEAEKVLENGPSSEETGVAALTKRVINFVETLTGSKGDGKGADPRVAAPLEPANPQGSPSGVTAERPKADLYRPEFKEIKALEAAAAQIGERIYIMFPNVSFFGSASTDITNEGRKVLERFSQAYMPFAGKTVINIVGFADERAVRPIHRFRDNLELSALRAVSAQRVLEGMGVPLNRTRLMGHGIKAQLLPDEQAPDLPAKWALSRKIMLVIEPEGT